MENIVDTAKSAGNFTTLITAVKAAGLVDTLCGNGPFTVLAPSDAAFAKVPAETLKSLLADKSKLTAILKNHVLSGKIMSKEVGTMGGKAVTFLQGDSLSIDTSHGVKIGAGTVTKADIDCSNGVIHAIDTVLMPAMAA